MFNKFLLVLDSYYISWKELGKILIKAFIYIFFTLIIFLILRFFYLGESYHIIKYDNVNFYYFFFLIIFLLLIILYNNIITKIFFKDVIKIYIFLAKYEIFQTYVNILTFNYLSYLSKTIRILLYRISTNSYNPDVIFFSENNFNSEAYDMEFTMYLKKLIDLQEMDYTLTNKKLQKYIYSLCNIVSKRKYLQVFFYKLSRFFFYVDWITNFLPNKSFFMLTIIIFISIDIINGYYFYINYYLFFFIFYRMLIAHKLFVKETFYTYIVNISYYFYKNNICYDEQRSYILNENLKLLKYSIQNRKIEYLLEQTEFKNLLLLNFCRNKEKDSDYVNELYTMLSQYNFFFIVLLVIILGLSNNYFDNILIVFFNYHLPYTFLQLLIILGMMIIMYKSHKFIINMESKDTSYEDVSWAYKKKIGNLFWILLIIQLYFLWIVFFYPLLFYVNSEILINLHFFKIIKIFTVEDKINFIYSFFDIIVPYYLPNIESQDYLRFILRNIDFFSYSSFLESNSLKDLKIFLDIFIHNHILHNILQEKLLIFYSEKPYNPFFKYFGIIKIIILIGLFCTMLNDYSKVLKLYKEVQTIKGIGNLVNKVFIMSQVIYKKPVVREPLHILKKISEYGKLCIKQIIEFF